MKSFSKLLAVIGVFSLAFLVLRLSGSYIGYDINTLISNLGGLSYLYSTVGTLFAVFAAFVIVSESQDWVVLSTANRDEVRDLNELLLWSRKLSPDLSRRFASAIEKYLAMTIDQEWASLATGPGVAVSDETLSAFHDLIADGTKEDSEIGSHLFAIFMEFLNHRAVRIEYSRHPLPIILRFTVTLTALVLIIMSLFIGVQNIWLDYAFTLSIAVLGTVVLLVIDDLDNPLRPGEWYLTSDNHKRLLENLHNVREA